MTINATISGLRFFLRDHARPRRADGDDESGARTAHITCGAEPRGGRPADRGSALPLPMPDGSSIIDP